MKINWANIKESKIPFPINVYDDDKTYTNLLFISQDCMFLFMDLEFIVVEVSLDKDNTVTLTPRMKKSIQFLANDERISGIVKKDSSIEGASREFLIHTTKGNIYTVTVDTYDFYFEVMSFKIRQNYIYNYTIHCYCGNKILIEFDSSLYLCEISTYNTLTKSCLLKINYLDEKILDAYVEDSDLVLIYTNKFVYLINLNLDGMPKILYKKDDKHHKNYFSGVLFDDCAYFIKDECTLGIQHLVHLDHKMSIKVSSKNYLNKVSFFRVLFVNKDLLVITNESQNELYFLNNKTYKLIHRETILFERRSYILHDQKFFILGLNLNVFSFKYKIGSYSIGEEVYKIPKEPHPSVDHDSIVDSFCDLSLIENDFFQETKKEDELKSKQSVIKRRVIAMLNKLKVNLISWSDAYSQVGKCLAKLNNWNKSEKFISQVQLRMFSNYIRCTQRYFLSNLILNHDEINIPYLISKYKEKVLYLIELSISNKDHVSYLKLKNLFITINK